MHRDAIGAKMLYIHCRTNNIGIVTTPGVPQRGYFVDVY
jgi:hypothetical protein